MKLHLQCYSNRHDVKISIFSIYGPMESNGNLICLMIFVERSVPPYAVTLICSCSRTCTGSLELAIMMFGYDRQHLIAVVISLFQIKLLWQLMLPLPITSP